MLAAIIFLATSGCTWNQLPPGFGLSGVTAFRRFTEWSEARVWAKLHRLVLDELGSRGEQDWSRCAIDSVSVRAGDGSSFPSAAHLASYVGLAPAARQSGTSIHGEHAPRGGNRQLKRAMFLSAFAALHDPASRGYYNRCRARGKTHTQALLRLARHRISVLFAMLRDGTFYEPQRSASAA